MSIIKYNPQSLFYAAKDEMDKVFDVMMKTYPFRLIESVGDNWQPQVDVIEKPSSYVVTADIPGVDPKDIKISVAHNVVTIHGEKNITFNETDKNYKRAERYSGSFYRQFSLPSDIDEAKIVAKVKNGVLTLEIPKGTAHETKYIEIQEE